MRTMLYCKLAGVFGFADVSHRDPAGADALDGQAVQIRDILNQAIGIDVIVAGADLDVARRQNEITIVNRANHVHHAHLPREQLVWIDVDHGLPVLAPEHGRDFRTVDHRDLIADLELGEIVKLRFIQPFAFHGNQANRKAGGVELQHQRRQRSGRQALQVG